MGLELLIASGSPFVGAFQSPGFQVFSLLCSSHLLDWYVFEKGPPPSPPAIASLCY